MAVTPPSLVGIVSSGRTGPPSVGFNTLTIPHTAAGGGDVLVVFVQSDSFATEAPIVTWKGTTCECVHAVASRGFLYQLFAYPTGAGDLVVFHDHAFGATLGAVVCQVANYGGFRWAERTGTFWFDPTPGTQITRIYAEATDLVLSFFGWPGSGSVVAADAGQTVLANQSGSSGFGIAVAMGQVIAPVETGNPPVAGNYTQATWTSSVVPFNSQIEAYLLAINGLDRAAPIGAPESIGRVTHQMSLEQQPTVAADFPDFPQRWRHEVPSTHRTLAVLAFGFDMFVDSVEWHPDGGTPQALTAYTNTGFQVWTLTSATPGLGYMRLALDRPRWYGASAFSLRGTSLIGDILRGGIDPGGFMVIDSTVGGIVIDRISHQTIAFQTWTAGSGGAGQSCLFQEPIYGSANVRTDTTGSSSGASSWTIAVATTTQPTWTQSPSATYGQAGISYVPTPLPELEEEVLPIRRVRRAPVVQQDDQWIFHKDFQLDLKTGIGLDGATTTQGHDPQVMLRWSNNGGRTWSNEHWVSAGKIGQYRRRALWRRLGRARNRVYELTVSDPVAWQIVAAYLAVEGERPS